MSKHLKPTPTMICAERMTTGTWIMLPQFSWPVQIADIVFDGFGYSITVTEKDWRSVTEASWTEDAYIDAGQSVEFAGVGEPVLRSEASVSDAEREAKADAIDADILRTQGRLNAAHGHVCREIDERLLTASVADAIGVSAVAAE